MDVRRVAAVVGVGILAVAGVVGVVGVPGWEAGAPAGSTPGTTAPTVLDNGSDAEPGGPAAPPGATATTAPASSGPAPTVRPPAATPTAGPVRPAEPAGPPAPVTGPTTPTAPTPPAVLRPGASGDEVRVLQERLVALGYWLDGPADGVYGSTTAQAVMAFQKVAGLQRDGLAGPATLDALAAADRPPARSERGSGRLVEIDLARQVLLVVDDGEVVEAFNTSTGAPGWSTPPGRFTVDRHIDGVRHAPLGDLYRPKYFNAGIAVHGSPSIPGHPASHGCARVHDRAMDHLWASGALELGTTVWVY